MVAVAFPDGRTPVLLSAHAEDLITSDAAAILDYLDRRGPSLDVADVSSTVLRTRRVRRHRALVRAADSRELADGLRALIAGVEHPLVTRSSASSAPRTAFVFPGQGTQWPSMGAGAHARLPEYRAEADLCAAAFDAAGVASPMTYLLADPTGRATTNDFTQVEIQGAQFVHGVALARVWRSCGVLPDVTIGHSLGEIGAAYVAGTITLPVAVAVVTARATLVDTLTGPYRVAVLGISSDEAQAVIAMTPGWVELSVVNSQSSVAVSGDGDAVAAVVQTVSGRGSFAKEIEMWFPAHTSALDPLRSELESLLPGAEFADSPVHFIGSTSADVVSPGTDFSTYWYENLRSTVRFDRAIGAAVRHGVRAFVELSAHPALLFAMGDLLDDADDGAVALVGSGRRDESIVDRLSADIAALALADPGYRWADLVTESREALRHFPFAPMRADHLWAAAEPLTPVAHVTVGVERWDQVPTVPPSIAGIRAATVIAPDLDGGRPLAEALRTAIDQSDRVRAVRLPDADLLIVVAPVVDRLDAADAADDVSRRIDEGLLRYVDATGSNARDVWLVTVGAEQVEVGEPVPLAAQAAFAAMHRSMGFEHVELGFHHLDLPSWKLDATTATAAIATILAETDGAADLALRATATVPTAYRRSIRAEASATPTWSATSGIFDDVLITGGPGAVGMHFARYLAEHGARRIVLLSRRGAAATQLAELRSHGVEVLAARCDITDAQQVSVVAAEIGGLGPTLVIHTAGTATIAPRGELTATAFAETFSAKVVGLDVIAEGWPMRADTRMVLCSSVSGLWGGRGHTAYSAANRLLDAAALQLRARGRLCTSVRFGLWEGSGTKDGGVKGAGIIDAEEVTRVERSGLRAMAPYRAVRASLRDHVSDPLVFAADPDRLRTFLGAGFAPADDVEQGAALIDVEPGGLDASAAVAVALGSVLRLADPSRLDLGQSLLDLGVDSLLALDLRKKLKQATGRSVPLATLLGGITGTALIGQLTSLDEGAVSRD